MEFLIATSGAGAMVGLAAAVLVSGISMVFGFDPLMKAQVLGLAMAGAAVTPPLVFAGLILEEHRARRVK